MKEAQGVVKALAASRRMKRSEPAVSCTEVGNVAIQLTTLVLEFPSSPQILVFSATIISFPSTVVCTDDEKGALAAVDEAFDEAVDHLDAAIEAAQSQLMTLTGVTASPEDIASVVATASTVGETTAPSGETTTPADETTAPSGETTSPADETTTPADGITTPADETTTPAGETTTAPATTAPSSSASATTTSTSSIPSTTSTTSTNY